jgi:hypothetical protein
VLPEDFDAAVAKVRGWDGSDDANYYGSGNGPVHVLMKDYVKSPKDQTQRFMKVSASEVQYRFAPKKPSTWRNKFDAKKNQIGVFFLSIGNLGVDRF